MPPPLLEDHILVLHESGVFPLNKHLLCLFTSKEGDLLRELYQSGVCVA